MSRRLASMAITAVALTACADTIANETTWSGTITDSVGIPVVQNPPEGLWGPGEGWRVEEELSIGSMEGEPEYQFGAISGADADADGNIFIADAQASEVRVFDSNGMYLRTIGKPGSGPGEFGLGIAAVAIQGGALHVPDMGNARVSTFDLDGTFQQSFPIDLAGGIPVRWDRNESLGLIAQLRAINPSGEILTGEAVVALGSEGEVTDTVATLPPGQSLQFTNGQPQIRVFESEPIWDVGTEGGVVMGKNDGYRFEMYDESGSLERVVQKAFTRQPVREGDKGVIKEAVRDQALATGAPAEAIDQFLSTMQFADFYPAFMLALVGPNGTLWVQRLRSGADLVGEGETFDAQDIGSPEWDVFDQEGRYLGIVEFPARFQPFHTLGNRFYGVARGEFDVQQLKVYRLVMD